MRAFSRKSYASVVDVAISNGLRKTKEAGLPYDIAFFTKAMWTAYPYMRKAPTAEAFLSPTELNPKHPAVVLTADFMTAVQCGSQAIVRDCLDRMRRLQRTLKFRMVEARHYPEPTALRDQRRVEMETRTAKANRTYAQQVDDAIARGIEQTKENNRRHGLSLRYDVDFFARALWRAKAFMEFALATDPDDKKMRKFRIHRQDFLIAVQDGSKGTITRMLDKMAIMAGKRPIAPLPNEGLEYPTPTALLN